MKLVLTDKALDNEIFPNDVNIVLVTYKSLDSFNHNNDIIAIIGSRAMAIKAGNMDLPNLLLFQLTSAGYDGVPLKDFRNRGVIVANAGDTYSVPIAETVIFGMLSMAKKLRSNPNNRRFKIRRKYCEIQELSNKNVLILGAGSIGTHIAKRLFGFDVNIVGYALTNNDRPYFSRIISGKDNLINEIGEFDYVISTLPGSDSTKCLIDKKLISKMKKSSVFINVGRKTAINENDLYLALKNKSIAGAVLDMFEIVPNPITNKFRRLRNVIILPGVAAVSKEVNDRLRQYCQENVIAVINGLELIGVVNRGD